MQKTESSHSDLQQPLQSSGVDLLQELDDEPPRDHQQLDKAVHNALDRYYDCFGKEKSLSRFIQVMLLYAICDTDPRLLDLGNTGNALISEHHRLAKLLDDAWIAGEGYKRIRSLKLLNRQGYSNLHLG